MSDGTAFKRQASLKEVLSEAVTRRANVAPRAIATATAANSIETNPVYKIVTEANTTPEQKRDAVTAFLASASTKEESRSRVQAYRELEEFLQAERERMAQEIIRLTDTQAFSELQAVYRDLSDALIDFDTKMRPLTDIVDAIYVLRTNDKTLDAFREIKSDREREAEIRRQEADKEQEISQVEHGIAWANQRIAELGEQKAFFEFGNVKQSAREEIAKRELELKGHQDRLVALAQEVRDINTKRGGIGTMGEFEAQKDKLRELLDISGDVHKERQEALVAAALHFVDTAKTRIGSVRQHLGQMNGQIDNLYDANGQMSGVYAILADGIKQAADVNQVQRAGLAASGGTEETMISRMAREEKATVLDEHLAALGSAAAHTTETYADLASQTIRIKTMRDSTIDQIDKARNMGTQGVAGVADRLSVVLQAVSSAALGESSAMAKDTLQAMVDSTNRIAQKETIRVAMGVSDANADVLKAIDDLGAYGEVVRNSTEITRQGLTEMQGNLAKIKALAESVHDDIHDAISVAADVHAAGAAQAAPEPLRPAFGLGR